MQARLPILVISRQQDGERRDAVRAGYARLGLEFDFLDATDGHDNAALRPFAHLIAEQFWQQNWVKPGALGAFFSHYRAWQWAAQAAGPVLIAEDDSLPSLQFPANIAPAMANARGKTINFVNNRLASWLDAPDPTMAPIDELMHNHQPTITAARFRGPGADGYVLTQSAARAMIKAAKKFGTICGVDWFLLAMTLDLGGQSKDELVAIRKQIGAQSPRLQGFVHAPAAIINSGDFPSALRHKERRQISELKAELAAI